MQYRKVLLPAKAYSAVETTSAATPVSAPRAPCPGGSRSPPRKLESSRRRSASGLVAPALPQQQESSAQQIRQSMADRSRVSRIVQPLGQPVDDAGPVHHPPGCARAPASALSRSGRISILRDRLNEGRIWGSVSGMACSFFCGGFVHTLIIPRRTDTPPFLLVPWRGGKSWNESGLGSHEPSD